MRRLLRHLIASLVLVSMTMVSDRGHSDEDPGFELVRGAAPALKVRQSATLSLSIVPHAGHRLLLGGPVIVRLRGEGLRPQRQLYHREEAVDPRADVPRFELAVTADKAGPARLEAHCTFYLCRGPLCRPIETSTTFAVTVEEAKK
jgi:hypothetical protein